MLPSASRRSAGADHGPKQRSSRRPAGVVAAAIGIVALLAAAGCGQAVPASNGGPATVSADHDELGTYLVDESGHALYLFAKDEKGESYCNGACESIWPPYEASGTPKAGSGVSQGNLGTITRDDGSRQVTYNGVPLYYYAGDGSVPDATKGEDVDQFGDEWYLVSAKSGAPVEGGSEGGSS
jgi:predicted lipoprotein with Yx(FWY)xxD motif